MRIVIDVGCATYGGDESITYLLQEFKPDTLIGLDPALDKEHEQVTYLDHQSTTVYLERMAAWVYNEMVGFRIGGLGGHVDNERSSPLVACRDLAEMILDFHKGGENEVILKMDAEGAEYVLLPHLVEQGADRVLKLAWIEWHCEHCQRGGGHREGCRAATTPEWQARKDRVEGAMRCEMHEWSR